VSAPHLIRRARQDECALLTGLALRSKASWGYSDTFMAQCVAELTIAPSDLKSDEYFVLESDGEVIGFCALLGADDEQGELAHVFIEPSHQREGHGLRLVEHAKSVARARGWRRLRVEADPNASEFYRSCGGNEIGTVPSGSIAGRTLPLFEIPL
jgi:N-acetylglutamate synthase-like GNAT family acetyltransferase